MCTYMGVRVMVFVSKRRLVVGGDGENGYICYENERIEREI